MEIIEELLAIVAKEGYVEEKFFLVGVFLQMEKKDACKCELCLEQRKYYGHEVQGLDSLENVMYYSMCRDSLVDIDIHLLEIYTKIFLDTVKEMAPVANLSGTMWRYKIISYIPTKLQPLFWGPEID